MTDKLTILRPSLVDLLEIAKRMPEEEVEQYLAATGFDKFDPEDCARLTASYRGVEYMLVEPDGTPVCAFGCYEIMAGVFQTWMLNTVDTFTKHGKEVTRVVRRTMHRFLGVEGVRRIQTYALAGRGNAVRWYGSGLGMKFEGTKDCLYQDGRDAVEFSLTAKWANRKKAGG